MYIKEKYIEATIEMVSRFYPNLSRSELVEAIGYSWDSRFKDNDVQIENNYKKKTVDISLSKLVDFVYANEPIITSYGVLFRKSCDEENPLDDMIQKFIEIRGKYKKEMFKHPKGTELFDRYNLLQLLAKINIISPLYQ